MMWPKTNRERLISGLAFALAVGAVVLYIFSGKADYEVEKRQLLNADPTITDVQMRDLDGGAKYVEVKCADGSSYNIFVPEGETDYDALAASKC